MNPWIINPELGMVDILSQYGRYLENDYRMIIEYLVVPNDFEEYTEKTGRRFVIVGGSDSPWSLVKSVFLCLKLAGPESVIVRTPHLDESFLIQNVFENHAGDIEHKVFVNGIDELNYSSEWLDEIEKATDIIVFGEKNAMEAFRDYETVDRRVWEHGNKFSFGIIQEEHLTPMNVDKICSDFFYFYGDGALAPKFYFVVGTLRKKHARAFNNNIKAFYGQAIEEYRDKMPMTKKSDLVEKTIASSYVGKHVRYNRLKNLKVYDNLYGDVKLVPVADLDEIEEFIKQWHDSISTVAINIDDDLLTMDLLEDMMVTRICHIGNMQFPEFFEQHDSVDDFNIFVDEERE
jgi:hypothetical protein